MSVRPASARLAPAPGAPPPPRWPTMDPRRANYSVIQMVRSLVEDVKELKTELVHANEDIKLLNELRARDHSAREATFTGRFVAMGGAFADEKKKVYDVKVGQLNDAYVSYGELADDTYPRSAKWLATVRFTEAPVLQRVNYDGKLIRRSGEFDDSEHDNYEIKCVARSYMLKHTGWQSMFPNGKKPDSVAPYALF